MKIQMILVHVLINYCTIKTLPLQCVFKLVKGFQNYSYLRMYCLESETRSLHKRQ